MFMRAKAWLSPTHALASVIHSWGCPNKLVGGAFITPEPWLVRSHHSFMCNAEGRGGKSEHPMEKRSSSDGRSPWTKKRRRPLSTGPLCAVDEGEGATMPSWLRIGAPLTISTAIRRAAEAFKSQGVPEPLLSAEYLMLHALGLPLTSRAATLARVGDKSLDEGGKELLIFSELCRRRLSREPVQYIVGSWDFHRITLDLRPPVLIPRPETEELVEWVLEEQAGGGGHSGALADGAVAGTRRFLDVGCGSGAIGLALLSALPASHCTAIDPNPLAVELASENARRLGLAGRCTALQCDMRSFSPDTVREEERFDFIVSNPPYIPSTQVDSLQEEVRLFEDRGALDGGEEGVDVILDILRRAPELLSKGGSRRVYMEVDVSHPHAFDEARKEHDWELPSGVQLVEWRRDLGGLPRFCCWHVESR